MISGIAGTAVAGVNAAYANFDRAASAVVAQSSDTGDTGDIAASIIQMDSSQVQIVAAIAVAKKVNDMLAADINIAGYGVKVDR
ncbi:MAG: hypothetical protein ABI442_15175 [Gemmatimonadaceae bacterium]